MIVERVAARRPAAARAVPGGGPGHHRVVQDQQGLAVRRHERAGGQVRPRQWMEPAATRAGDVALAVQVAIERVGVGPLAVERDPAVAVALVGVAAAQRARPVPGGEGDGLVVEEQQRVPARRPLGQALVLVLERAHDPQRAAMGPHDVGALVEVAAVTRPRTPQRDGHDVTGGRDAVAHGRAHGPCCSGGYAPFLAPSPCGGRARRRTGDRPAQLARHHERDVGAAAPGADAAPPGGEVRAPRSWRRAGPGRAVLDRRPRSRSRGTARSPRHRADVVVRRLAGRHGGDVGGVAPP